MYRDISISQRLDRIGELLAKGVCIYMQKSRKSRFKMTQGRSQKFDIKIGFKSQEKALEKGSYKTYKRPCGFMVRYHYCPNVFKSVSVTG